MLSPGIELQEWNYEGESHAAQQRFAVDEVHLYTGLGELDERGRPTLARLYMILARRDHHAWKIALSFSSALLPGADETMIDRNDHVRAGAIFGKLSFLPPIKIIR